MSPCQPAPRNARKRHPIGGSVVGVQAARRAGARAPWFQSEDMHMLKFIGGTVGVIFLVGLLVILGLLALIF